MQPYFFPYLNYFRLFGEADYFVYLDDVSYSSSNKWVNRNVFLGSNGELGRYTFPIRASRFGTNYRDLRYVSNLDPVLAKRAPSFESELIRLREFSRGLNYFNSTENFFERLLVDDRRSILLWSNVQSVQLILDSLQVPQPEIIFSSDLRTDHSGQRRVLEICKSLGATKYLNLPGGKDLYNETDFRDEGIRLEFVKDVEELTAEQKGLSSLSLLQTLGKDAFKKLLSFGRN